MPNSYPLYLPEPYEMYAAREQLTTWIELNTSHWSKLSAGALLRTSSSLYRVTSCTSYADLESLVDFIGIRSVYPDKANYSEAKAYFDTRFSESEVDMFGLLAIGIEPVKGELD